MLINSAMASSMLSTVQEVKSKAGAKMEKALAEIVTFKEVIIDATAMDSRFGWRDHRFMSEYIYNRCSGGPANNIFWEEGKRQF